MTRRILFALVIIAAMLGAIFTIAHLRTANHSQLSPPTSSIEAAVTTESWDDAIAKIKEDRGSEAGGAIEIPDELRHYSDRHWFLATQVAEIAKYNVQTCQDYVELAAMLQRGEIVPVPAVTATYVLFGVGAKADDKPFTTFKDDKSIELYNDDQLTSAYNKLAEKRTASQTEIDSLKSQSAKVNKRDRARLNEIQNSINDRQSDLQAIDEDKAVLDEFYGRADSRQKLLDDYGALRNLAANFNGRSFNIDEPADRLALKINMLSSLRPQALKILEEVAAAYQQQFSRPLPVSSLMRPEQYQHALHRVNRNAVLIETPPHSTGLAFDIDYRYMSGTEQTFLMAFLAHLKDEGRIEVIRERNANYHVFAFINGARPADELITASLDKASAPTPEPQAHHAVATRTEKTPVKGDKRRKR